MDCPRCGATTDGGPECPACGVLLAKARARPPHPPLASTAARPRPQPARPGQRGLAWGLLLLALAALATLGLLARRQQAAHVPAPTISAESAPALDTEVAATEDQTETLPVPEVTPAPAPVPDLSNVLALERDREAAERLAARLRSSLPLREADLQEAEDLRSRHAQASVLVEAVLLRLAQQARARHDYAAAAGLSQRALALAPQSVSAQRMILGIRLEQGDWPAAEEAARTLLLASPADPDGVRSLAYALVRQDRSREAGELLGSYLETHADPAARALLDRLQVERATEADLGRQSLSHFNVRYDGATQEEAGRLVLRVLERHYATLVSTFSHQPAGAIPVILLSEQSYYDATGAPIWSGGHYDTFDGRVRIPIAGIEGSRGDALDQTVLHELTHAFVADRSAGLAPRELHEGLAQIVQGRRSASLLGDDGLRALADGRIGGVGGFYLAALVFTEDLLAQRGQGGINDVLAAMARTRSVDTAFREVYGNGWRATYVAWSKRLRSRHGS